MPTFSQASSDRLMTCHPDLVRLFVEVVKGYDCTVLCGFRNQADQEAAFKAGTTLLHWPHGRHNQSPSMAVDVVPYPLDWSDVKAFHHFAGYVRRVADDLGITVRWGGAWDGTLNKSGFTDLPHYEIPSEVQP